MVFRNLTNLFLFGFACRSSRARKPSVEVEEKNKDLHTASGRSKDRKLERRIQKLMKQRLMDAYG